MSERMKNFRFFLALIVLLTIYLNVGWALGTYHHNYIIGHEPETAWQTFWAGGWGFWATKTPSSLIDAQIASLLIWPVMLAITLFSWFAYFFVWFLWLVFAGGLAKLVGLG